MEQKPNIPLTEGDYLFFEKPATLSNESHQSSSPNHLTIVLCKQGYKIVRLNFTEYRLEPNTLIVLFPNTILESIEESDDYQAIFFTLMGTNAQAQGAHPGYLINIDTIFSLGSYLIQHPQTTLSSHETHIIEKYIELIKERYIDQVSPNILRSLISTLLIELNEMFSAKINRKKLKVTRKEVILWQFLNLLRIHYKENRTVEFYADKLCVSPKHLSAVIKQLTRHTAHEVIADVVVMAAKQLLKTTALSIQEISDQLNFANQSFFGKFFKQHTGLSPSAYREK